MDTGEADDWVEDDDYTDEELYGPSGRLPAVPASVREARRPVEAHPTHAAQVLRARDALDLRTQVGLAVRSGRRTAGLSQRAFAEAMNVPRWVVERIETHAESLALETVLDLLHLCGHDLVLMRAGADGTREAVPAEHWPTSELVAKDARGRRLPAHGDAARTCVPKHWVPMDDPRWGCDTLLWTWSRRPSSDPMRVAGCLGLEAGASRMQ